MQLFPHILIVTESRYPISGKFSPPYWFPCHHSLQVPSTRMSVWKIPLNDPRRNVQHRKAYCAPVVTRASTPCRFLTPHGPEWSVLLATLGLSVQNPRRYGSDDHDYKLVSACPSGKLQITAAKLQKFPYSTTLPVSHPTLISFDHEDSSLCRNCRCSYCCSPCEVQRWISWASLSQVQRSCPKPKPDTYHIIVITRDLQFQTRGLVAKVVESDPEVQARGLVAKVVESDPQY